MQFVPNHFWQRLSCINHTYLMAFGWAYHINNRTKPRPEVWLNALCSFKDAEMCSQYIKPQKAVGYVCATILLVLVLRIHRMVNMLSKLSIYVDAVETISKNKNKQLSLQVVLFNPPLSDLFLFCPYTVVEADSVLQTLAVDLKSLVYLRLLPHHHHICSSGSRLLSIFASLLSLDLSLSSIAMSCCCCCFLSASSSLWLPSINT